MYNNPIEDEYMDHFLMKSAKYAKILMALVIGVSCTTGNMHVLVTFMLTAAGDISRLHVVPTFIHKKSTMRIWPAEPHIINNEMMKYM